MDFFFKFFGDDCSGKDLGFSLGGLRVFDTGRVLFEKGSFLGSILGSLDESVIIAD